MPGSFQVQAGRLELRDARLEQPPGVGGLGVVPVAVGRATQHARPLYGIAHIRGGAL